MHHQEQDLRSFQLHEAAIELMRSDAQLIRRAISILQKWSMDSDENTKPLREEWMRILLERDWNLALDPGERGKQLRQSSPVSCVLPTSKRLEIIRHAKRSA